MLFDTRSLVAHAGFVHLGSDHIQEIERVVDARSTETLRLLLSLPVLARAVAGTAKPTTSSDSTRSRRYVGLCSGLLSTSFGRSLLGWGRGFLFSKETCVLSFTSELCFALFFLIYSCLGFGLCAISPSIGFLALLL
jgi:hypothetical protein